MQESFAENFSSVNLTDSESLWEQTLATLKADLDPQIFAAYFGPLRLIHADPLTREVALAAPSRFLGSQVERNFAPRIAATVAHHLGIPPEHVTVRIEIDENLQRQEARPRPEQQFVVVKRIPVARGASDAAHPTHGEGASSVTVNPVLEVSSSQANGNAALPRVSDERSTTGDASVGDGQLGITINPKYTFENFVVGNSNQFCEAAARRVAEQPGMSYNPLFIYGGVGLGKTHLLHAIGNSILQRNPRARILYMSSETFTNELIAALRHAKMDQFKNRMRSIEVLLIDDIQFMRGKERTQEEFFHTFNALYNARHQIVITSDKLPSEIPGMEERLQTRFSWGLTADIQAPDFETRVAILKRKAALEGFAIDEDVVHFIAEKVSSNVRELEGALTRLHAISALQRTRVDLPLAQSALRPILQPKNVSLSIEDIKKAVAQHFSLKVSEIISKRRTKNLSFPRHIAMYLCRKHTTASYPEIGSTFGGRDHSSVIHAANVVDTKVTNDREVKALVEEIERRLFGN